MVTLKISYFKPSSGCTIDIVNCPKVLVIEIALTISSCDCTLTLKLESGTMVTVPGTFKITV